MGLLAAGVPGQSGPGAIGATFHHDDGTVPTFRTMHMGLIPRGGASGLPAGWNTLRGKVLVYDEGPHIGCDAINQTKWALLDPTLPPGPGRWVSHTADPLNGNYRTRLVHTGVQYGNLACSGHSWTADGRLFIAGGNDKHDFNISGCIDGSKFVYLFDPTTGLVGNGRWRRQSDLDNKRWYPGCVLITWWNPNPSFGEPNLETRLVVLGSGGLVPQSGNYQAFKPDSPVNPASWDELTPGVREFPGPNLAHNPEPENFGTYAYAQLMSNGQLVVMPFVGGTTLPPVPFPHAELLNHAPGTPPLWTPGDRNTSRLRYRLWGCSLLFPNLDANHKNSFVVLGGDDTLPLPPNPPLPTDSIQMCRPQQAAGCFANGHWWTDLLSGQGCLNRWTPMAVPRYAANVVLLPDGSFLVIGGGASASNPMAPNDIVRWDGMWRDCADLIVAPGHNPGGYGFHSAAILLPNGAVLIGGGDFNVLGHVRYDYQIYLPWYLAEGHVLPTIEAVNGTTWTPTTAAVPLTYNQSFTIKVKVDVGVGVNKVVLMRPSSVTHSANYEQRYIELEIMTPVEGAPDDEIIARTPTKPPSHPTITASDVSGPPGLYMVFVLTNSRVPSEAAWIELRP